MPKHLLRKNATFSVGPGTPGMLKALAEFNKTSQGRMLDKIILEQARKASQGGPLPPEFRPRKRSQVTG